VTKDDCYEFLSKLRTLTGKIFRLPTEAEWEYAARGGKKSHGYKYSGSNICSEVAWTNYCGSPHPVATKIPNELGLYDMSGNVGEQCSDYYDRDYYSHSPLYNPTGPSSPGLYGASVVRGGSWGGYDWGCPVWYRGSLYENSYNNGCGFRIVLIP
jgi:formylglycine-generating enzyme required for sulfatase activity